MIIMMRKALHLTMGMAMLAFMGACGEQGLRSGDEVSKVEIDSTKTTLIGLSGKLFSIPSPVQTAMLIKEAGVAYNAQALHPASGADQYQSKLAQAANLGLYGTSMAYTSLYDDGQAALKYYKAVDKLANNLGIIGAIDASLVKRLAANVGNADSLLMLSGKFYYAADEYLKENERFDIASYILLGAWAEAAYLTSLAAQEGVEVSRTRLAEQKESVKTLLEVIDRSGGSEFHKSETYKTLSALNKAYTQVERNYQYAEPEVDAEKKTTKVKSITTYQMDNETLALIHELVKQLRNNITEA